MFGLFCFSAANPASTWEIWLFCWTYYTGIVDSTNMRTEIDQCTKIIRYTTQAIVWCGTFTFSIVYWHYYRTFVETFDGYMYQLRASQIWLGWVLLVTTLASVLFLLSIIKLSFMIEELNKRSKSKVQLDKFVTFMHLLSLIMIVFVSFINFIVSVGGLANDALARCQIVVCIF